MRFRGLRAQIEQGHRDRCHKSEHRLVGLLRNYSGGAGADVRDRGAAEHAARHGAPLQLPAG